jgi:hypothetical protein
MGHRRGGASRARRRRKRIRGFRVRQRSGLCASECMGRLRGARLQPRAASDRGQRSIHCARCRSRVHGGLGGRDPQYGTRVVWRRRVGRRRCHRSGVWSRAEQRGVDRRRGASVPTRIRWPLRGRIRNFAPDQPADRGSARRSARGGEALGRVGSPEPRLRTRAPRARRTGVQCRESRRPHGERVLPARQSALSHIQRVRAESGRSERDGCGLRAVEDLCDRDRRTLQQAGTGLRFRDRGTRRAGGSQRPHW